MVFDSIFFEINKFQILKGIYLKIEPGKITGLFGVNGSGKSTLLKIGAGMYKPNNGNIFINGNVFFPFQLKKRYQYIAFLSQDSFIPHDVSVNKLLEVISGIDHDLENDEIIKKFLSQKISSLSGGELRYLEIKLLFSLNRDYYLLDEPFTGIEPKLIEEITKEILTNRKKGKGILITDHYHRCVTGIVDTSYVLKNGQCTLLENAKDYINFIR